MVIGSFVFYAQGQIKKVASRKTPQNISYLIVLGAKVNGTTMSLSLLYRAQAALTYLQDNPETIVIATGGKGEGEWITEAEAIQNFLLENGIHQERILIEDQSTTTLENLTFAKDLFDVKEAVIVSNDFHLFRAIKNAQSLSIKAYPLAAKTPQTVKTKMYMREYAAILRLIVLGY